jgi:hypothetical protein
MKTLVLSAIALCMLLSSCVPYPYYGDGYDGGRYQSNGSEWILPAVAAAAIITGVAISQNHPGYGHGYYGRPGYGHHYRTY